MNQKQGAQRHHKSSSRTNRQPQHIQECVREWNDCFPFFTVLKHLWKKS